MPPVRAPFRIYIDTSVLGGCFDREFSTWSNALVRDFRAGRLIPVLSDVTAAEVQDAPESVRDLHQELLGLVEAVLPLTEATLKLAAGYEARGICPGSIRPICGTSPWRRSPRLIRS
jgi:hypothetical protein